MRKIEIVLMEFKLHNKNVMMMLRPFNSPELLQTNDEWRNLICIMLMKPQHFFVESHLDGFPVVSKRKTKQKVFVVNLSIFFPHSSSGWVIKSTLNQEEKRSNTISWLRPRVFWTSMKHKSEKETKKIIHEQDKE